MLLGALSLILACLLALLFFKDYKTRSRMKLAEMIPGPKALPLVGNLFDIGVNSDSKLHMFMCLDIRHEDNTTFRFDSNSVVDTAGVL
jgi:hypothetical protein